ncbi:transcriptional regulator [Pseudoxanthomonas sp. Root65]|uniref:LysR family transcriptional regulator n=1 Tax=Pseudoxanthomonas sp. Root65 TaxID=1736576 RepID=UPI0006F44583|nr:LysR family transcriptional regulator [Pseudoxanthomonas sp. Root65]KRA52636.1 transcriptional regulator [Pseudoxanthomonas sp. Root65]
MNPSLLPALAWFALVTEHGSFSRAAQAMGVSPAALSQSLKSLERELGVRLLYRTTRHMSLTEAGQRLYDTLRPALGQITRAVDTVDDADAAPSGLLRINTSRLAAKGLIEPHLREFHARYPAITLELVMADGMSNIIADGCDAGIRLGQTLAEHMVAVPVSPPLSMAVAASPDYLARHGVPPTPSDLVHHNCLNYRFVGSGTLHDWEFSDPAEPGRPFTRSVAGSLVTNDDGSMIRAALQGLGLMQVVDLAIRAPLADGRLVRVLAAWTHRHAGFYLYAPSREHMPAKVRALIDFLVEKRDGIAAL